MRPQLQRVQHAPADGQYGDCFRTAIAAMLDLDAEEVPHVFDRPETQGLEGHALMEAWLRQRGLIPIWVPFGAETPLASIQSTMAVHNPGVPFGLCGQSKPGVQHYIVCRDGAVACDPSGSVGEGLIGPCDDGLWWVMFMGANLS